MARFVLNLPPPTIVSEENFAEVFEDCWYYDRVLGNDTETLGKGHLKTHDQIVCMSLCPRASVRYFVPRPLIRAFTPLLTRRDVTWGIFNSKFDAHRFANMGITLGGRWADGNVLDWLLDEDTRENRHGLKECALDYLGLPTKEYKQLFGKDDVTTIVPGHPKFDLWVDYASLDAWLHREVCILLLDGRPETADLPAVTGLADVVKWHDRPVETLMYQYWYEEEPQLQTLWRMERRGLPFDLARASEMAKKVEIDMDRVAARINAKLGRPFNPNSTPQKQELLFGPPPRGLGLTPRSFTKGSKDKAEKVPQTDEKTLSYFAEHGVEICQDLVEHSELNKLAGYVRGLPGHVARDGRIHTNFSPTKVTGRLSSSDPNLQNIPRKDNDKYGIRSLLVAPTDMGEDYVLIVADYAQLEMRVLADISGDEAMIQGILDGLDMHSYTAARMNNIPYEEFTALIKAAKAKEKEQSKYKLEGKDYPPEFDLSEREAWAVGMRSAAKSIGFGIVYGITEHGLSVQLTEALKRPVSKDEALALIELYLDTFPGVRGYMETTKLTAMRTGRVQTYRGRFRRLHRAKVPTDPNGNLVPLYTLPKRRLSEIRRALRQAINARIQGSAHDIVKRAMLYCENDAYLRDDLKAELLLQVHDELIWQCPRRTAEEAVEIIQHHMEHPFSQPLKVPLVAEPSICLRWSDGK